jgi:5'-methylthioadenosine phosphorylase
MVTDYDVWAEKPVSAREIIKTMGESVEKFKKMILNAIPKIPKERECSCAYCLKDALV